MDLTTVEKVIEKTFELISNEIKLLSIENDVQ